MRIACAPKLRARNSASLTEDRQLKPIAQSLIAAALALAALPAAAQDNVVNVYNWSDYVGEGVLEDFTKETGIEVVYDVYDSMEMMETKLLAGGSGYDVIVPTDRNLQRLIEAGVVQKLDKSKIPNLEHQWDVIAERLETYDPGLEHSTNYMWGTTAIGYNVDKIAERMPDAPVDSWAMIFDPAVVSRFADCGVHLLDSPDDMIPAALNYLGLNPDSKDPAEIEQAGELLKSIRPHIQKFHSSEYINALANGDICLAVGYSGDVLQARDRAAEAGNNVTVEYSIPKEGAVIWLDNFAIPADAPHPENAHAFIDFMLRPDIAARNVNYVFYASGSKSAQEMIDEEILSDPAIYPDEATLGKLYTTTVSPPRVQREMTRVWTEVKTGQ
jgi:putrescine transport system substrate-binding protein